MKNMHTPKHVLDRFKALDIEYRYYEHPPVFTVEEARRHCAHIPGGHCKNLFLRSRKKHNWLLVLNDDAWVDLRQLARDVGAGTLGFGSTDRLMEFLGVTPGSVTPLALVNDPDRQVHPVFERGLMDHEWLNFHPLVNTATVSLSPTGLMRFVRDCGHEPRVMDLPSAAPPP